MRLPYPREPPGGAGRVANKTHCDYCHYHLIGRNSTHSVNLTDVDGGNDNNDDDDDDDDGGGGDYDSNDDDGGDDYDNDDDDFIPFLFNLIRFAHLQYSNIIQPYLMSVMENLHRATWITGYGSQYGR